MRLAQPSSLQKNKVLRYPSPEWRDIPSPSLAIMASSMALRMPLTAMRMPASMAARRNLAPLSTLRFASTNLQKSVTTIPLPALQQSFRRAYAQETNQAPAAVLSPTPKPKRRFRFFRWTWRFIYVSALGGAGYLAYQIWDLRNPADQMAPDPSKKNLVILGMHETLPSHPHTNTLRNWLGRCLSP